MTTFFSPDAVLSEITRSRILEFRENLKLLPVPETDFDHLHKDEAERFCCPSARFDGERVRNEW